MSKALLHVSRPDYELETVNLKFNNEAFNIVANTPLMFEESKKGILITVPVVDHHKSFRVHKKRRIASTKLFEDFKDGEYPIKVIDPEMFLIEIFHE